MKPRKNKLRTPCIVGILFLITSNSAWAFSAPRNVYCTSESREQRRYGYEYQIPVNAVSLAFATGYAMQDSKRAGSESHNDETFKHTTIFALGVVLGSTDLLLFAMNKSCIVVSDVELAAAKSRGEYVLEVMPRDEARTYRRFRRQAEWGLLAFHEILMGSFFVMSNRNPHNREAIAAAATIPVIFATFRWLTFNEWDPDTAPPSTTPQVTPTLIPQLPGGHARRVNYLPGVALSLRF